MYYSFFIIYIVLGLILALAAFWWAAKHGQFQDQQRARFLPLDRDDERSIPEASRFSRRLIYGLGGLIVLALIGLVLLFIYAKTI